MNCYTVSSIINPVDCNTISTKNSPFRLINLDNVIEAEIRVYTSIAGLVDIIKLHNNRGLIYPYYWDGLQIHANATYVMSCRFKNLCYEDEFDFRFSKYGNMSANFNHIMSMYNSYNDTDPYPLISGCETYTYLYKFNFDSSKPFYYSSNSIFAGQDVLVKNGEKITLQAEKKIVMAEGFRVERGAKFHALLSPKDFNSDKNSVHTKDTNMINTNIGKQDFIIYPNPAKNEIRIQALNMQTQTNRIEIMDMNGRMLDIFLNCGNSAIVDVSGYQTGIYFVRFVGENAIFIKQFIKL